jgi:hypothetical protein
MSGGKDIDKLAKMFLPRLRCGTRKSKSASKQEQLESKGFADLIGGRISHAATLDLEGADSKRGQPRELGIRNWVLGIEFWVLGLSN